MSRSHFWLRTRILRAQYTLNWGGLKVFFYPHKQEEFIGTNGLESMREPFLSTLVNVVLFRERYGNTPWTGVELAAIQDSCLRTSFRSLVFVQLNRKDAKTEVAA
jgi:hypothetical protein